ncbi:hypothetical protein [Pseudomonas japonica]|uniref:Uncharacterized protein n=1 Tax=Pseudomonas japonica TaxID=256466 RepID=A0A239C892_9PSED|nr:hypothetical protein [Pseudomonas japonica]SNS15841.1 hypothetical protein SAMN05444352_10431 [Pseudomonas japonica]
MTKPLHTLIALVFYSTPSICLSSVDLGIADDETYKRPNAWSSHEVSPHPGAKLLTSDGVSAGSRPGVSIAWRNANQVEEVEVRVINKGSEAGEGKVTVNILSESGKNLLHLEPPEDQKRIRIPAYDRGGKEGKVLRMKAEWGLNALIDRFDIARTRYHVEATVETVNAEDANLLDNRKTKSWNIPFRVNPKKLNAYNYTFTNHGDTEKNLRFMFEHSSYPENWEIAGIPPLDTTFTLKPGETVSGALTLNAPEKILDGAFLESRISLVDTKDNSIFLQNEWFQVFDTIPPVVTDYRLVSLDDGRLAIQALVSDQGSGILEATGVSSEFSVDGGKTWARKAHNYKVGNFVRPTLFETVIGPFRKDTTIQLRFTAFDTAGNAATIIPTDASSFVAPPGADELLQNAYVFPRTQKNPIFEIDQLQKIQQNLKKLEAKGVELKSIDFSKPNAVGVDPARLKELGIGPDRKQEVLADLERIRDIDLDFNKVSTSKIKRLDTDIDKMLNMTTIEVKSR